MTMDELNSYLALKRSTEDCELEVIRLKDRIARLDELAKTAGIAKLSDMPKGVPTDNYGPTERLAVELADLRDLLKKKIAYWAAEQERCEAASNRVIEFIASLTDDTEKLLYDQRVIYGKTWLQVAIESGCGTTSQSASNRAKRILERIERAELRGAREWGRARVKKIQREG